MKPAHPAEIRINTHWQDKKNAAEVIVTASPSAK